MKELVTIPLEIEAKGEITTNNFAEFAAMVATALEGINTLPETTEEFGTASEDVKRLEVVEKAITTSKGAIVEQLEDMNALFAEMDELSEEVRVLRLDLSKKITAETNKRKEALLFEATKQINLPAGFRENASEDRLRDAIKGKRTEKTMQEALDREIAQINDGVAKTAAVLDRFIEDHGADLIGDRHSLSIKSADVVFTELQGRIAAKEARDKQAAAEEEAKQARAEAAAAQEAVAEQNAPPKAPPVGPAYTVRPSKTPSSEPAATDPADELATYIATLRTGLAAMKPAREKLTDPTNQAKALEFGKVVNAAWNTLIS